MGILLLKTVLTIYEALLTLRLYRYVKINVNDYINIKKDVFYHHMGFIYSSMCVSIVIKSPITYIAR